MSLIDINEHEHEFAGWEKLEELTLACRSCQKDVIKLIRVADVPQKQKIQATCPYCDDMTWMKKLEGHYVQAPAKDSLKILDIQTELEDGESRFEFFNVKITVSQ